VWQNGRFVREWMRGCLVLTAAQISIISVLRLSIRSEYGTCRKVWFWARVF
jgi:hypothetical protein